MPFPTDTKPALHSIPIWVDNVEFGGKLTGRNRSDDPPAPEPWREQSESNAGILASFFTRGPLFVREVAVALPHVSAIVAACSPSISHFDLMVEHLRKGETLPHGLICLAGSSDACHGYHGRGWRALDGNLHLSVHWAPRVPIANYGAGVLALGANACSGAVDELVGKPGVAGIKWVNDVVVGTRKIAGVLAWAQTRGAVLDSVVLGIGLNVERVPEGVADAAVEGATAVSELLPTVTLGDALGAVLRHLADGYAALASGRVDELVRVYRSRSVALGQRVRWVPDEGGSGAAVTGKAVDIAPDLALVIAGQSEPLRGGRIAIERSMATVV